MSAYRPGHEPQGQASGLASWSRQDTAILASSTIGTGLSAWTSAAWRQTIHAALEANASDRTSLPSVRVAEAERDGLDAFAVTEQLEYQPRITDIGHPNRHRAGLPIPTGLPRVWVVDCRHVGKGPPTLKYLSRYLYRHAIRGVS